MKLQNLYEEMLKAIGEGTLRVFCGERQSVSTRADEWWSDSSPAST